MSFLWKSAAWRWIVTRSRASGRFFLAFGVMCVGVPWAFGELSMWATSRNEDQLREMLKTTGRKDAQLMARVNKERLAELLGEIQRGENTDARYQAALRGETFTGPAHLRRYGGTSMVDPVPRQGEPGGNPTAGS